MPQKIALAISGGGARGIAAIGVIREIEARGWQISSIAGTSIGAAIGGFYAAGKLDEFESWIKEFSWLDLLKLMDFSIRERKVAGKKIFQKIEEWVGETKIEDLEIPLAIVTTDLAAGEEVVFRDGILAAAMRASIAIPNIFTPAVIDGRELYDGGIVNQLPVNRVARWKGDKLIAIDLNVPLARFPQKEIEEFSEKLKIKKSKMNGAIDLASFSIELIQRKISEPILAANPPDFHVKIPFETRKILEFQNSGELVDFGQFLAQKVFDEKK